MPSSTGSAYAKRNVLRMMERLGVEPGAGVLPALSLRYATLLRSCESCASTQACGEWLARARGLASLPPRFCPCGDLLFEVQLDQPGHGGDAGDRNRH